jgi:hypothetical protein
MTLSLVVEDKWFYRLGQFLYRPLFRRHRYCPENFFFPKLAHLEDCSGPVW